MAGNLINLCFKAAALHTIHSIFFPQEIFTLQRGITLQNENILSTFEHADINLRASIKRIEDI